MIEIAVYRRTLVRRSYGGNLDDLFVQTLRGLTQSKLSNIPINLVLVEILTSLVKYVLTYLNSLCSKAMINFTVRDSESLVKNDLP